jgi:Protein of unknown function (DUF3810)
MKFNFKIRYVGICLGIITIWIHFLAYLGQEERIFYGYHRYVFRFIRVFYDYTFGLLPFPVIYLLFIAVVLFFALWIKKLISYRYSLPKLVLMKRLALSIFNFMGWVFSLFYFLWAFNYYGPNIEKKLSLPDVSIDSLQLLAEFKDITEIMIHERNKLSSDTTELKVQIDWSSMEDEIRKVQTEILSEWGDKVHGRVRVRRLYPEGLLLRISTAGVYIPFVAEGHIDPGMHAIQWPFTAAHEMAHGYGYTDEGVCNFIGLLTCIKSKETYIRYSGLLSYWKYLFYDIKLMYPASAKEIYLTLDTGIKADLSAIRREMNRFPDILPEVRDILYDSYLKTHGVEKGLKSYNEMILQVLKWKKTSHAFPFN